MLAASFVIGLLGPGTNAAHLAQLFRGGGRVHCPPV
jgi:hypothetical protein